MENAAADSWELFRTTVATEFSNRTDAWAAWLNGPSIVTTNPGPIQSLKVVLGVVSPWITPNQHRTDLAESTVHAKAGLDKVYAKELSLKHI